MSGRVEAIWKKRSRGGLMDAVEHVKAIAGKGLEDDANFGTTRQVTVIEQEVFDRIKRSSPNPNLGCEEQTSWSVGSSLGI